MTVIARVLLIALFVTPLIHASETQPPAAKKDLEDSAKSCRVVQFVVAVRGSGEDIRTDDDFAIAAEACKRLQAALSKSDANAIQREAAALRPLFAQLGMAPATPREQLEAAEAKVAKLSGESLVGELDELAKRAFEAGELGKADAYSKQVLQLAAKYPDSVNHGNAIYTGNTVQGRIALQKGDIGAAGQYLLAAGATPGSPQLGSFGPSMTLAKELLERGQSALVLQFLGLCKKFWEYDSGKLQQWETEIRKGNIPDFGTNLRD